MRFAGNVISFIITLALFPTSSTGVKYQPRYMLQYTDEERHERIMRAEAMSRQNIGHGVMKRIYCTIETCVVVGSVIVYTQHVLSKNSSAVEGPERD